MNPFELPEDRLATTDERGKRLYLYPADVKGRFRRLRSQMSAVLVLVFLGLPWVRIGGEQALLLDIPHRRFAVFGLTFWAHDVPLLFFAVGGVLLLIAFVTAIWGRAWCGWACPQTVFVDGLFRRIERWIEGDALARRRLDESLLGFDKLFKKTVKWSLFSILALIVSHSFLAYFVGTGELSRMMRGAPSDSPAEFTVMAFITLVILFDFGWFREQFCTLVCPYGRFQSVLMDRRSSVVAYDLKRGEPRRGSAAASLAPTGDCVNCYRCVQVCPTGIDIRRGVQLECIACTACIDACDEVMSRLKRPQGLIRHATLAIAQGQGQAPAEKSGRPRVWVILALLLACGSGLAFNIAWRTPFEVTLIRAVDQPYQLLPGLPGTEPSLINHFKLDLRNQTFVDQRVSLLLEHAAAKKGYSLVIANHQASLASGASERADVFVRFPKSALPGGRGNISLLIRATSSQGPSEMRSEAHLVGPLQ